MNKAEKKINRYRNLVQKVNNWPKYIWKKTSGFDDSFKFDIKNFGSIEVPQKMLGPFRENFFDDIYFRNLPEDYFKELNSPVVIDIGANVGFFSMSTFAKFPGAQIYSFEPHPYCYQKLSEFHSSFDSLSWKIFNQAVSDHDGVLELSASTLNGFATMASVLDKPSNVKNFTAETIRLEAFLKKTRLDSIDLIKLDCEGSEYDILYSLADQTLQKIGALTIETHKGARDDQNLKSLREHLEKRGYSVRAKVENEFTGYIWAWRG